MGDNDWWFMVCFFVTYLILAFVCGYLGGLKSELDEAKRKVDEINWKIDSLKKFEEDYHKKELDVMGIKEATLNSFKEEKK